MGASPDQLAAMMAYLQTLQAAKAPGAPTPIAPVEPAQSEASKGQQELVKPVIAESSETASSTADAVASMAQSVEPAQLEPETTQATETPALDSAQSEESLSEPVEEEDDDFVVDPILTPEAQAARSMALEFENLMKLAEEVLKADQAEQPEQEPESVQSAAGDSSMDIVEPPEQIDALDSAVETERATIGPEEEGTSTEGSLEAAMAAELAASEPEDLGLSTDGSLKGVVEDEVEKRVQAVHKQVAEDPETPPMPSRLPRNVAAYYLQPLRRVAEYGVPACDLQLRSYSLRPLESFCDFALRAAYYLGLPAYGPVPLPKIIERWTVPRSHFIFKKSQENFERITRRRLIQIKDGHPETVQIWLAFLQKHQQAAVGLKANLWEFSSVGTWIRVLNCHLYLELRILTCKSQMWLRNWVRRSRRPSLSLTTSSASCHRARLSRRWRRWTSCSSPRDID